MGLISRVSSRTYRSFKMARGHQKIQSQQKNAEKKAKQKKQVDNKKSAQAALKQTCQVCKTQMPDPKTYRQHFESKHPKFPLPAELKDVVQLKYIINTTTRNYL